MKRTVARMWIAFSEVSGGRVPARVERWLGSEAAQLRQQEKALTRALREEQPRRPALPPALERRIEAALRSATSEREALRLPWLGVASGAVAAVAICVGVISALRSTGPGGLPESPEPAVVETRLEDPEDHDLAPSARRWKLQIDDPLEAERDRLMADVAMAARVVAGQLVPSEYLPEVHQAIDEWGADDSGSRG